MLVPWRVQARDFIHQNPAGALAPLPVVLPLTPAPTAPTPMALAGRDVGLEEQRHVLLKRRWGCEGLLAPCSKVQCATE